MSSQTADWNDALADLYAQTIAASGYAHAVVPLLGGPFDDVLDIGAGSGELTRRVLSDGAVWRAVEPHAFMQKRLSEVADSLSVRGIRLSLFAHDWQCLPPGITADVVLAANLGATHHEPAAFFDEMRPRARKRMCWVVPAQAGPSTFCLAGFLPPDLHGADVQPAVERCLAGLGAAGQPREVVFANWTYRMFFPDVQSAQQFFLDRLSLLPASPRGQAVQAFVQHHLRPVNNGLEARCEKRSAVLHWYFD